MALNAKVGSFNLNQTTGNQAITGLGFQPKLVIFWGSTEIDASQAVKFMGAAQSSTARWAASIAHDDFADEEASRFRSDGCINILWPDATARADADFVSMDADGFTINVGTADNQNVHAVHYLALGGDIDVKVGTFDSNTSTGNQSVTGAGFEPKAVMFGFSRKSTNEAAAVLASLGIGWGLSSTSRAATHGESDADGNGADNESFSALLTDACIVYIGNAAGAVEEKADFVSQDADGFTINWSTKSATAFRVGYVALGGSIQAASGTFDQPTSTGNQAVTGVGFQPKAELFISQSKVSSASSSADAGLMIGGAATSSSRAVSIILIQDGVDSTSNPDSSTSSTACLQHINTSDTVVSEADFVSQDADGFTVNWGTADATQRTQAYLAIGEGAGEDKPTPITVRHSIQEQPEIITY